MATAGCPNIEVYNGRTLRMAELKLSEELADKTEQKIGEFSELVGKKVMNSMNLMADWMIFAPEQLKPEDEQTFIDLMYHQVEKFVGAEKMIGYYVEDDVLHCLFVTVTVFRGVLQFSTNGPVNTKEYAEFYKLANQLLAKAFGYPLELEPNEKRYRDQGVSDEMRSQMKATKAAFEKSSQKMNEEIRSTAQGIGMAYMKEYESMADKITGSITDKITGKMFGKK